jgi:hypothetical protein
LSRLLSEINNEGIQKSELNRSTKRAAFEKTAHKNYYEILNT